MDFYIDKTLYEGAPANRSERLPKEVRTYELLDTLHVPYSRLDHDATASIESCMEVEKLLGIHICKNLFLCNAQKTRFYLLMMPGNKKFKTIVFAENNMFSVLFKKIKLLDDKI